MSRAAEAPHWADQYRSGMSIEEIALDAGAHTATVRTWLHRLGVEMRSVGAPGKPKPRHVNPADHSRPHLAPQAAIVRPSVQRGYR